MDVATCSISVGEEHIMQCMEVWGGNQIFDSSLIIAGLDMWVYSRPFGQAKAGGDVYYVSSCATGRITRLLLADVAGHGEAVQSLATGLGTLMRRFVNYIDQSRFVQAMNGQFLEQSRNGTFATAVVMTFFGPTRELSLCNAGHPLPLFFRRSTGKWGFLEHRPLIAREEPSNLPLGIVDLADYDQFEIQLDVDDLVLCYTDSLVESCDADGQMLGHAGLLRVMQQLAVDQPATLVPRLLERIRSLHPGNLDDDDVTTLLFRANGAAARASLAQRLFAPVRIIGGLFRSWKRKDGAAPWPQINTANMGGAMLSPLSWFGRKKLS